MKRFYCNGKKGFCDSHLECDVKCQHFNGEGGEDRDVDETPAVFFDNDRQRLIDLLVAREEIKDANAYDRAESLADYLLENGYGYRRQTEGKVDK